MSTVTAVPIPPVKSSIKAWLWLGVILAIAVAFGLAWVGTRGLVLEHAPESAAADAAFLAWHKGQPGVQTTKSGVQYLVIRSGKGPQIVDHDGVMLNIEGRFRDGTVFQPKGADQWLVTPADKIQGDRVPGYSEAIHQMNRGAIYRVWIPADQGYGASPPNPRMRKDAMLIFDIEVQEHLTAAEIDQMRQQQAQQQMLQQQMMQQQQQAAGAEPEGAAPEGRPEATPKKR